MVSGQSSRGCGNMLVNNRDLVVKIQLDCMDLSVYIVLLLHITRTFRTFKTIYEIKWWAQSYAKTYRDRSSRLDFLQTRIVKHLNTLTNTCAPTSFAHCLSTHRARLESLGKESAQGGRDFCVRYCSQTTSCREILHMWERVLPCKSR
jgi:hypothetical protein